MHIQKPQFTVSRYIKYGLFSKNALNTRSCTVHINKGMRIVVSLWLYNEYIKLYAKEKCHGRALEAE